MFPTTEDELADIQSTLQQVAQKFHEENYDEYVKEMMAIQLIPWEYRQVISRRGYLTIFGRDINSRFSPITFPQAFTFCSSPLSMLSVSSLSGIRTMTYEIQPSCRENL